VRRVLAIVAASFPFRLSFTVSFTPSLAFSFMLLLTLSLATPFAAWAQYPDKPVKIVVGFPPGTTGDVIARLMSPRMSDGLGQQVIVENRPGAGSSLAAEAVARASADGYTMLLSTIANAINPSLYKLSFDFERDLAPVALLAETPGLLVAHPSAPGNIRDLVAAAKSWPGTIAYGSSGNGTVTHLWGELFNVVAGTKLIHVPYKGSSQAVTDLLAGRIALLFTPASTVVPHVKAEKLRALGVIGRRRLAALPDVPTLAESGVPGFEASLWFGLNVPGATPAPVVQRLSKEALRVIALPELTAQLAAQSIEPTPGTSEQFAALVRQETEKWARVVRIAGVKIE
jgi:tripartite-type tricarboxylate transporter receptor subunit TctC